MARKSNRRQARARSSKTLSEALELEEQLRSEIIPGQIRHQIDQLHDRLNQLDQLLVENENRNTQQMSLLRTGVNETNFREIHGKFTEYFQRVTNSDTRLRNKITDFRNKVLRLSSSYKDRIPIDFPQLSEKWSHFWHMFRQLLLFQHQVELTNEKHCLDLIQFFFDLIVSVTDSEEFYHDRILIEKIRVDSSRVREKMKQVQLLLDEEIICQVERTPSLLQKYTKFFQLASGRILTKTETNDMIGNDNTKLTALFGENDTMTTIHRVCSICLIDFQQNDQVLRNASKLATNTCTHIFHKECITAWIQQSTGRTNCPCCRRTFLINA